jgi:hypothetical protein
MATNAQDDNAVDDSQEVTEEDLRNLKYGNSSVETPTGEDETGDTNEDVTTEGTNEEDETNSDDQGTDDVEEADKTESNDTSDEFVKEFPNIKGETLEDYARSLEEAYNNSTSEAMRLKIIVDQAKLQENSNEKVGDLDTNDLNPLSLYAKQKMDEEIQIDFEAFKKKFPQVNDQAEYNKFTVEVSTLSNTILQSQKRLASPKELYQKAAVILGWEPDMITGKDRLGAAIKGTASMSKSSSTIKKTVRSKVTDQMIAVNRLMYPGKTDDEIRKELEPYV